MKSFIQLKGGHYEIGLPWREGCPALPDNPSMVENRLHHLKKRLEKEPILLEKCTAFMKDLLQKGFARKVPQHMNNVATTWLLPHHPVFHPKKPEKTRVVFGCSAKYRDTSLNGQLSQGPDLTNSLVGVYIHTYIHTYVYWPIPQRGFSVPISKKKIKIKTYTNYLKLQLQIIRISFLPLKFV